MPFLNVTKVHRIRTHTSIALASVAMLLLACGGGGSGGTATSTAHNFTRLVVFGDSLSDVGTHKVGTIAALGGGRWTVNSTEGGEIWVERVAKQMSLPTPCAAETGLKPNAPGIVGAAVTSHTDCFNYAQGSARVTSPFGPNSFALQQFGLFNLGLLAKPIRNQLDAHLTASGNSFTSKDMVVVMAGANDVFMNLNSVGTGSSTPQAAITSMATEANNLATMIKNDMVGKGATRVLVLNIPNVAKTPFGQALDTQTQQLTDTLTTTFNNALRTGLADVTDKVIYGDVYTDGDKPDNYSSVSAKACANNALQGSALACTAANLSTGDVSKYQYADDVHPTPYGHQQLASYAFVLLQRAGWVN